MDYASPKEEYIMTPADGSGKGITVKELAEKWKGQKGCSFRSLKRKCAEENWRRLRAEFWQEALDAKYKRQAESLGESVADAKQRYIRIVQVAIGKLVEAMKEEKLNYSLSDLEKLARLDLLLRGQPTEVKQIRSVIEINVNILEDAVAGAIQSLMREGLISREGARRFAELFAQAVNASPFLYELPQDPAEKFSSEVRLISQSTSRVLGDGS